MFLQWPRELSLKELPAHGCRKWQLRKWAPEWWIAGNKSSQCVTALPINNLHCTEQGHTWARVSLTRPRRDYKPNALFSEGFFQASLKFRNLDLLLYFVQCEAELVPLGADYGKLEEKKMEKICLLSLFIMKSQRMRTACAGETEGGIDLQERGSWDHPCRL